jgi:hypothetical protein
MATPLRVELFDKAFARQGPVDGVRHVTVTKKHMIPGLTRFAVRSDHPRIEPLLAAGARCIVWNEEGEVEMSGRVARFRGDGPEQRAITEFDVTDDLIVLQRVLGWVIPTAAISAQGTAGTNWTMEAPAETVLKAALQQNAVDRLGLPIQIPTDEGRGATVKARLRFQTLHDRLILVEDGAGIIDSGIGIALRQRTDGVAGLRLDVWEPTTHPQTLNERSGVLESWSYAHQWATATRGVGGGQGEGTLRSFRAKVDTALETEMGWKDEFFRDARDTNVEAEIYERIDETLAENAAKTGLAVTLSDAPAFRQYQVGDTVSLAVGGVTVTDRLNETTLSLTASGGFQRRPRIGDRNDDPDTALARVVQRMARALRNQKSET